MKVLLACAFLSHTQLLVSQCMTPSCLHPHFRFVDDPRYICPSVNLQWPPNLSVCMCVFVLMCKCNSARMLATPDPIKTEWLQTPIPRLFPPWRPRNCSPSHWHLGSFRDITAVLTVNKFPLGETKGKFSGNGELEAPYYPFPLLLDPPPPSSHPFPVSSNTGIFQEATEWRSECMSFCFILFIYMTLVILRLFTHSGKSSWRSRSPDDEAPDFPSIHQVDIFVSDWSVSIPIWNHLLC